MHRKGSEAWKEGFMRKMRVLTKFQANLVIPKYTYGYFSIRGRGYINNGAI